MNQESEKTLFEECDAKKLTTEDEGEASFTARSFNEQKTFLSKNKKHPSRATRVVLARATKTR
jgi:hypothetical protein